MVFCSFWFEEAWVGLNWEEYFFKKNIIFNKIITKIQ